MKKFEVNSSYRQFYVADSEIQSPAPEDWTDAHVKERHNTLQHISALCPAGDITARVISLGPGDLRPELPDTPDFEVHTSIDAPSGQVGVYEWPFELKDHYRITPGRCDIRFTGYKTDMVAEQEDYYLVEIREAEQSHEGYLGTAPLTQEP